MVEIIFQCLQCSRCCRNLFYEFRGQLQGLSLFSDEKDLFPHKLVLEQMGIGWGLSGPKHIVNYQLNVNVCPHISKENSCKVYDRRPLACQAFPLMCMASLGAKLADPTDCSFLEENQKKIGALGKISRITPKNFRAPEEWQAIEEMNNRIIKFAGDHLEDGRVLWGFDLKSKEWQILMA